MSRFQLEFSIRLKPYFILLKYSLIDLRVGKVFYDNMFGFIALKYFCFSYSSVSNI